MKLTFILMCIIR